MMGMIWWFSRLNSKSLTYSAQNIPDGVTQPGMGICIICLLIRFFTKSSVEFSKSQK